MIEVTVTLHSAVTGQSSHLGTAWISNDGTGDKRTGHYTITLSKRGQPKVVWKQGSICGFPRQKLGAWDLLCLALLSLLHPRIQKHFGGAA